MQLALPLATRDPRTDPQRDDVLVRSIGGYPVRCVVTSRSPSGQRVWFTRASEPRHTMTIEDWRERMAGALVGEDA